MCRTLGGRGSLLDRRTSFDALDSPRENRYLDRRSGKIYYWPNARGTCGGLEVIAPLLTELVQFQGGITATAAQGVIQPVHDIRRQGFTLSYTDWSMPAAGYYRYSGAFALPAAVEIFHANSIVIENSVFKRLGQFAIELGKASRGIALRETKWRIRRWRHRGWRDLGSP